LKGMHDAPMWSPRITRETTKDEAAESSPLSTTRLWVNLSVIAVIVGMVGWVIGQAGLGLVAATGWPSAVTGFTITTAITSLPELVTLIAAVRMGSVTLGIGGIVGGNVFDTIMITIADLVYTPGTIYADAGPAALVLLGGTALITAVLALGLVVRDRRGIGFEGVAIPGIYLGTVVLAIMAS
jgi:cation:H+ antiporter